MKKIYSLTFLLLFVTVIGFAADRYCVATGNWIATTTWSSTSGGAPGASVPTATDNVFIEGSRTVTIDGNIVCLNLTISTGSTLQFQNNADNTFNVSGDILIAAGGTFTINNGPGSRSLTINIVGDFINNGTFNGLSVDAGHTSTVVFIGALESEIFGLTATTFYNLTVNNAGGLLLGRDVTVTNVLSMVNGKINTDIRTLTLTNPTAASQIIGYSNTRYVYSGVGGRLQRNGIPNNINPYVFPVGTATYYLPVTITRHGASSATANFAVKVFEGVTKNGAEGGIPVPNKDSIVDANWIVDRPSGTGSDIVQFEWDAALEGPSFGPLANGLIRISRHNGTSWSEFGAGGVGGTTANNSTNFALQSFSSFSPFMVGAGFIGYVLPVKFGPITAFEKSNGVQLDWTVYTETNMDKYVVERSANGSQFTPLGEVAARNTTGEFKYGYFDANPLPGTSYYRLRSVDIDSKAGFSNIVRVNLDKNDAALRLYPNPANGGAISYQAANLPKGNYAVRIFNAAGQQVYNQRMAHQGGAITQTIQLPAGLAAGQYNLRMESETTVVGTKTFMVQ